MDITKLQRYVRFAVARYLRNKPELADYRDDLQQEGFLGLLHCVDSFDPSHGIDRELWYLFRINDSLRKYINRRERKHFRKPPVDEGSPYWDIPEIPTLEELEDVSGDSGRLELMECLAGVPLTDTEVKVLDVFLESGDQTQVASELGVSRQYVSKVLASVVLKAKLENDG